MGSFRAKGPVVCLAQAIGLGWPCSKNIEGQRPDRLPAFDTLIATLDASKLTGLRPFGIIVDLAPRPSTWARQTTDPLGRNQEMLLRTIWQRECAQRAI